MWGWTSGCGMSRGSGGSLSEFDGDTTLVILPSTLQTMLELPEVLQVTADPDVAREDGATLLSAGHPALSRCADQVLAVVTSPRWPSR